MHLWRAASETFCVYSRIGSPMLQICLIVQFKSNTRARITLKIFCTEMPSRVDEKMSGDCIALANLRANLVIWLCSSKGRFTNWSYLVPMRNGIAVLLNPRACRYHSLMLLSVDLRERSNMKSNATASLHTSGSIDTNSRCPPRSQMLNVISLPLSVMVFSMKLTPSV